ncbi:hypothetical protein K504DRAFT_463691 [Pleomassaria siparia CBS 279.74]|uniref:Secretory phospholipase A2 n=1 Tax=Pleomassaria siparia CBS 279.74 TaxID=1314801 RepID=A0A6G1JSV2_9PLEO|nr:hypothetical protein K504DRAFT_463691 [Pleomassaria siparia CBS 279.74]
MKPIISIFVGLISLTTADAIAPRQETAMAATDRLLFNTTIAAFESARNALNPATLDWSSDGCSYSPDMPLGFDFLQACHRHDFGYRNYKEQSRFTAAAKAKIDSNLKADMYTQCATEGNVFVVAACKAVADVYYEAVKEFGSKRSVEFLQRAKRVKRVKRELKRRVEDET